MVVVVEADLACPGLVVDFLVGWVVGKRGLDWADRQAHPAGEGSHQVSGLRYPPQH